MWPGRELSRLACNDDSLVGPVHRDFLQLSRLLAANAVARLEGLDVADFAIVAHPVELPVVNGVESLDLEAAVWLRGPLKPYFAVTQAFVFERVKEEAVFALERNILACDS